jgi:glycosyltransferase involved in cell wall biosynthesis
LQLCLAAVHAAQPGPLEVLVVDDGSDDGSADVARARGARVLQTPRPKSGPAVARNLGARQARGTILFFVDADVAVSPDVFARLDAAFADPTLAAVFGSYDDAPAAALLSRTVQESDAPLHASVCAR